MAEEQPVLVVIAADPRSSHRAFEAMRIGVGIVAGENDVTFVLPSEEPALTFGPPSLVDQGSFAGEASILIGIDGIVRADERVEALERRVTALEGGVARGVREALRTRRRLARR